jgi:hypothetical protein
MIAEVALFLFLNLPFPKEWKSGIFKAVYRSKSLNTFLKIQLLLCVLSGLFYYDMYVTESSLQAQKNKLRSKSTYGACNYGII